MLYFVALMTVAAEILLEKSGIRVWEKVSSKKLAVDSEFRNFLSKGFLSASQDRYKVNLISIQNNIKLFVAIAC